jgi:protoporphyrinogen oxidase
MKVIIIGAGISGLAAAWTLQKNGVEAVVLEEKSQAGGRTVGTLKDGFVIDHGAQFFMKCYPTTIELIHEMNMQDSIVPMKKHKQALWIEQNLLSLRPSLDFKAILKYLKDLVPGKYFGLSGYFQLSKFLLHILRRRKDLDFIRYENSLDLDQYCFSDFVLRHGGRQALEYVLEPMVAGITLGKADELGALYGAALFWNLMQGNWILKNGIYSLPQKIFEKVKQSVHLSTSVDKIVMENNSVKGVETGQGFLDADAVICATTATAARKIIPDLPQDLCYILDRVQYRACCHVVFAFPRRVMPEGYDVISFPLKAGSVMAAFADSAEYNESYAPSGASLIHCYVYEKYAVEFNNLSDEKIISHLKSELKTYIPSIPDNPIFTEIFRWKEAMCFGAPGMFSAVNRLKKENGLLVKGLFFAGDYLNLASVEGSAASGIDAAEHVLKGYPKIFEICRGGF